MKKIGKYLLKALLALFAALPLKAHYALAGFVAWLAGSVIHYRTDDVMINLARCYPKYNNYDLRAVKKRFYRHFADILVESVWFGGCHNPKRLRKEKIVEILNPECLQQLYDNAPSVVVMYTHCGNWELLGGINHYNFTDRPSPITNENCCFVYRELSSKVWDEIMNENRCAPIPDGTELDGYIESRMLVRYVYSHKDEKKIYNVNTDQRPYFPGRDYIKLQFMGQECQTMSAAAALAHKFGFAVAYQRMMEKPDGKGYYIEYVPVCVDGREMSVEDMMKRYYELLEGDLREQPHNYLWTHRRWVII